MTEFQPGQTAKEASEALIQSLKTMEKAKQCSVLWFEDIHDRKLYKELGYSSINQYAEQELGFSSSRTGDYLQLCRSFKILPKVKEKVRSGELGYTAARVLVKVANEENEDGWLEFAMNNSRRELEREVKRAKHEADDIAVGQACLLPVMPRRRPPAVVPVRVCFEMSPTQFAQYEKLWEQVRKRRNASADKVEALLEVLGEYVGGGSPRGEVGSANQPPVQIHVHQCPECEKAAVQTSRGELEIRREELERAQCDCRVSHSGERNTASIPPGVRYSVLARARHKCQRPGCNHGQFLEVHHVIPRAQGGTNDLENLVCYCGGCHALVHEMGIGETGFMVREPGGRYGWRIMACIMVPLCQSLLGLETKHRIMEFKDRCN